MTISAKVTKGQPTQADSERLFKLLESIDWKLWEMYQMLKAHTDTGAKPGIKGVKPKKVEVEE